MKRYEPPSCEIEYKFPRLISGLREKCLLKLIEINPFKNRIIPEQPKDSK